MERKCRFYRKAGPARTEYSGTCHGFFQADCGPGDAGPVAIFEHTDGKIENVDPDQIVLEPKEEEV